MKKLIISIFAAFASALFALAEGSSESIRQLFNARLAENPEGFAKAAVAVERLANAAESNALRLLAQYSLALVADDPDLPPEVADGLTDEVLAAYLKHASAIERIARVKEKPALAKPGEEKPKDEGTANALAWYLFAQEARARGDRLQLDRRDLAGEIRRLTKAAESDGSVRTNALAEVLAKESELKKLIARADADRISRLTKAAELNNEQALNELGVLLVERARAGLAQANEKLRLAIERDAPVATVEAARKASRDAKSRLNSARVKSCGYFSRAADKNDANGNCNYGMCLLHGYGTKGGVKNELRALACLRAAAKEDHPQALALLGDCYRDGTGDCPRDLVTSTAYFARAAAKGNVNGLYGYGRALLNGAGLERKPDDAAIEEELRSKECSDAVNVYLRRAAERGHLEALFLYARCLMEDRGFEERPVKGVRLDEAEENKRLNEEARLRHHREAVDIWFRCALFREHAPSMEQLAVALLENNGIAEDSRIVSYISARFPELAKSVEEARAAVAAARRPDLREKAERRLDDARTELRETAAVYWLYRAARDYDLISAMERMGECCRKGIGGLEASRDDEYWWKTRAMERQGNRHAKIWMASHNPHRFDQLHLKRSASVRTEQPLSSGSRQ